ncbi:MAG TPA: endonuclease/exonuclease/phosphatase family protein [Ramlibacter sp.]|nr:endonuclease/exonuclease/phosphatase family protein [Ramlibacter sp.]
MKLVTWNTQWCRGLDGQVRPERIVQVARALADFDLLCLQEVADGYPRLPGDASADQFARLAQLLPGFRVIPGPSVEEWDEQGRRSRFGNLLATRLPITQVRHHALPWPPDPGQESMPRSCVSVTLRDPQLGAVRVMTTHLEYYSQRQRAAQAQALRELHREACAVAAAPPEAVDDGAPPLVKLYTDRAILCGDFNLQAQDPEYAALTGTGPAPWHDSWRLLHGDAPHPPTFKLYDQRYGKEPVACDFVFVSEALKDRVRSLSVDGATQASDHQPVFVEIG